jgi:hypothetical protein
VADDGVDRRRHRDRSRVDRDPLDRASSLASGRSLEGQTAALWPAGLPIVDHPGSGRPGNPVRLSTSWSAHMTPDETC